jgi:hypothetical protein
MAGSFSVAISDLSSLNIGESRRSELAEIASMVECALQVMVSSQATSVAFCDRDGCVAGTMSWTPVNSS